jgi:hypothetical protein
MHCLYGALVWIPSNEPEMRENLKLKNLKLGFCCIVCFNARLSYVNLQIGKRSVFQSDKYDLVYFHFVFTVHFYIILKNPPTKCTIDDIISFYSLTSPTSTCFGESSHHPQGDFALQRPFHSEGHRLCNIVAITWNVHTHTHLIGLLRLKQ